MNFAVLGAMIGGTWLASGHAGDSLHGIETRDTPSPQSAASVHDSYATFKDTSGNNFKVCWGADDNSVGNITLGATNWCVDGGSKLKMKVEHTPQVPGQPVAGKVSAVFSGQFNGVMPELCSGTQYVPQPPEKADNGAKLEVCTPELLNTFT